MNKRETDRLNERENTRPRKHAGAGASDGESFSFARSGLLTVSILAGGLLLFAVLWRAHQKAQFHALTTPTLTTTAAPPTLGGEEPLLLNRLPLDRSRQPEFSSATLLPGLGMQVLQLAASWHGETHNLFAAPSVNEAANIPVNAIDGAGFRLILSPPGDDLSQGTDIIGVRQATDVGNRTEADGGEATGTFAVKSADGRDSGVSARVNAVLTGRSFDVAVRVTNNALSSRAFDLTWSPTFAAPGGRLDHFILTLPPRNAAPGATPSSPQAAAFTSKEGLALQDADMDLTYVDPERPEVGDGPAVQLQNTQTGVVLRMVLLSPSIRRVRVHADAAKHTLTLGFSTGDGAGGTLLQAGETAEWHLRVDLTSNAQGRGDTPLL